jgi:Tol biopolymer transport system component
LGERVNSPADETCPVLSPDGKYLFLISNRSGEFRVYWIDAAVILPSPGSSGRAYG